MRQDWQISSLEEVVKFIDYRGKTPQKTEYGMRLITAKNVKMGYLQNKPMEFVDPKIYDEWMTRGIPKKGDVLFTTEAPLGNVAQLDTDEKVVFAQRIIVMQPKREVLDSTFLKYMLLSNVMQEKIDEKGTGATVKGIKSQLLKKVKIYFPRSLSEQKWIVTILDEAFEGIDRAIANTEKNLANSRELFESYLNAIFTQKGDGWEEVELGSLSERITKGSSPKWQGINYVYEPGILFVTSENVGENQMLFEKTKYVEEAFNEKDSKSILYFGDVLTNIVGASIGRTAIYDREDLANINQAVCLIRCKSDKLLNKYLSYLLNSPYFRQILHDNEINNARANLSLGFFRGLQIPLPSLAEQQSIVSKMDDLSSETQRLETIYRQKIAALNELKQSILQKAFTGELTADTANQTTKAANEGIAA